MKKGLASRKAAIDRAPARPGPRRGNGAGTADRTPLRSLPLLWLSLGLLLAAVSCQTRGYGDGAATGAWARSGAGYKIGERGPAGGYVFYDKGDRKGGWRYLEAAPADLGPPEGLPWTAAPFVSVETGSELGRGRSNTEAIFRAQGEGDYAAAACRDYELNGYRDWFLPSKDELNLMYENLKSRGIGDFRELQYWSSTQIYWDYFAWYENFAEGYQGGDYKTSLFALRPCRAF